MGRRTQWKKWRKVTDMYERWAQTVIAKFIICTVVQQGLLVIEVTIMHIQKRSPKNLFLEVYRTYLTDNLAFTGNAVRGPG